MPKLFELKQDHHAALQRADAILTAAENAGRVLTDNEQREFTSATAEAQALAPRIAAVEQMNTMRALMKDGMLIPSAPDAVAKKGKQVLSADYLQGFQAWVQSGGQSVSAALYEGAGSAGGYAVPITVDDQIVPLAAAETAIRSLATVIPTTNDVKIPRQTAFSTATGKAESGASTNAFGLTQPTLDQFTLSAFMAGSAVVMSFELAQDVPAFQAFAIGDMRTAQVEVEEGWYISGTGSGQAQGLLGNVGAGVTEEPDTAGNLVSIDGTLDLTGTLKAKYHTNASWLMNRLTSIILRKAQRQANLFEPVWTRVGSTDYLHGYPVAYAAQMPTAARGSAPILFGDFKQGYVIGDRGGPNINVKVLDQPLALSGQIALLAYRRTDGRVRRSEAIQQYNIAAS